MGQPTCKSTVERNLASMRFEQREETIQPATRVSRCPRPKRATQKDFRECQVCDTLQPCMPQTRSKSMKRFYLFSLVALGLSTTTAAAQVEQCVRQKIAAAEQRQNISNSGSVTCPAGDIVGFPPREQKHNRSGEVCITAPNGRVLVNENATSIVARPVSDNGGSMSALNIKSERQACVSISCSGAGVGQGRRWMEAAVSGQTKRSIPSDDIIQMTLECARNAG